MVMCLLSTPHRDIDQNTLTSWVEGENGRALSGTQKGKVNVILVIAGTATSESFQLRPGDFVWFLITSHVGVCHKVYDGWGDSWREEIMDCFILVLAIQK